MTPPPPAEYPPVKVEQVVETFAGPEKFDANGWVDYHGYVGGFNGSGQYTIDSRAHHNGINRIIGQGSFELTFDFDNLHFYPVGDSVSEGLAIWIKDDRVRFLSLAVKEDHVFIEWNVGLGEELNVPVRTVVSPDGWKLSLFKGDKNQLFNLNKDLGETTNLFDSGRHQDVIERLSSRIRQWQKKTKDTLEL
jgi:hypothetical protein